jgi:L-asparaginase
MTTPKVIVLTTGGTIGHRSEADGVATMSFDPAGLVSAIALPGVEIEFRAVMLKGSMDVVPDDWVAIARAVADAVASGPRGVVITHGTDTMEETAYFLDLVVKSDKPVVLVGSMRPATAVSADGPGNLYNAVAVAASPRARGRGVLVVMNDSIHAARDVEKMNTTNVDTFASPMRGPQGLVHTGKIDWFEPTNKQHTTKTEFSVANVDKLPRVDIIYAHANMPTDLIESSVQNGAKGVIVAGVGDGNMTEDAVKTLEKVAKDNDVVVVRSTRLPTGVVLRNNEIDDDKKGFVAAGELNPAKSRVLVELALTKTSDPKKVQAMFNRY